MRILAGDIGGTKTVLSLFEGTNRSTLQLVREDRYASQAYAGLEPVLEQFLSGTSVDGAGFGVAGPVIDGVCTTTNLPWTIRTESLQHGLGTKHVALRNDVEVALLGIDALPSESFTWLNRAPVRRDGLRVLVSVGTGFGRALLTPDGRTFPGEGGHATFGPRTLVEANLLLHFLRHEQPLTVEHVLSGPGLFRLYDYLVESTLIDPNPHVAERIRRGEDASAVVGDLGIQDADAGCAAAVSWFAELLGGELGNIAIGLLPRGGVYVWGGVALKLRDALLQPEVRDAFVSNDKMRHVLEGIPLALIEEPGLAVIGAREAALLSMSGE
jgi:glucokinase